VLLAGVGYLQQLLGAERILGLFPAAHESFFSLFSHGQHWATFALVWVIVYAGLVLQSINEKGFSDFLSESGIWVLLGAVMLFFSVLSEGTALHHLLLCLLSVMLLARITLDQWLRPQRRSGRVAIAAVTLAVTVAATALFAWNVLTQAREGGYVLTLAWPTKQVLLQTAWNWVEQRPLFGWGPNAFENLIAFQPNPLLLHPTYVNADSSLLSLLLSYGFVGTGLLVLPSLFLGIKFLCLKVKRPTSYLLFFAAANALFMGTVSFAFANLAIVLSFWILLVLGYQWSAIASVSTGSKPERPPVIFSSEEMQFLERLKMERARERASRAEEGRLGGWK
jgi:O-antigen ligase